MLISPRDQSNTDDSFFEKYAVCGPPNRVSGELNGQVKTGSDIPYEDANKAEMSNYEYILQRQRNANSIHSDITLTKVANTPSNLDFDMNAQTLTEEPRYST